MPTDERRSLTVITERSRFCYLQHDDHHNKHIECGIMGMLGKDEVKLELQGLESAAQVCFSEG